MARLVLLVVLGVLGLTAIACSSAKPTPVPISSPAVHVVTTIYPAVYFTQRVGGDRIRLTSIVPTGAHAHDFEPRPSDLAAISKADLVVYVSEFFETWMSRALESAGSSVMAVEAAHIEDEHGTTGEKDGHGHGHDQADPHVWLNPHEAIEMVERIRDALIEVDPEGRDTFEANADSLIAELESLESRMSQALEGCRIKTAVVSHEAYGHLLEDFGVEQAGLSGLEAEEAASPATIARIVDLMREQGIRHVLAEPVVNEKLVAQIAETVGATVLPLHPLEYLTSAEAAAGSTYFTIMDRNLESLQTALDCP